MLGLHEYRVETWAFTFAAYGRLENVGGVHLLRLRVTTDQAFCIERDIAAEKAVTIFATSAGELVLAARIRKVKARPDGPRVDLACLLLE